MGLEPSVDAQRGPRGPLWILGTSLITLAALLLGRALLVSQPEPTPASSETELQAELRWAADPERRRLAALLLASRANGQPRQRWQLLQGQGWGGGPLAPVAIKQQALAAERLGWSTAADRLWLRLERRFPRAAATADALYALGRHQPERRQALLMRFPAHPAALAAALEQATDPQQTPARQLDGAVHLAQWGPRWPGARQVLLAQCLNSRGPKPEVSRVRVALGLARLGEAAVALRCLERPATSLTSAADTLILGTALLQGGGGQDQALAAQGRAALVGLLQRWPRAKETDAALRALAEDPSGAALTVLQTLPDPWRIQAPVQARLALEGLVDGDSVLKRWPNDPASWDLRWQLTRRALLQGRWQQARSLLSASAGLRLPAPLAARERFWLGYSLLRLGQTEAAHAFWRRLIDEDGSGYYGWRARVRLGSETLSGRIEPPRAKALVSALERRPWRPLNSGQAELDRLWQAGQALEAWELWRHQRRGQAAAGGNDLRLEGLLRLGIGDDSHGLEQLERASLRLVAPSCRLQSQLEQGLHPLRFETAFQQAARASGLNPALLLGVAKAESQFMPAAQSPVGAVGLLQLMPETARELAAGPLAPGSLSDPGINTRLGARYLSQMLERWQEALLPAVASYNAGPGAVAQWDRTLLTSEPELWVEQIPYPETRLYVKKVLGNAWSYQNGTRLGCDR